MTRAERWWDAAVRALTARRASEAWDMRDKPAILAAAAADDADALLEEFVSRETGFAAQEEE